MKHRQGLLGEFLRKGRVAAQLSQKEVATRLGYTSPQFISNWERGLSSPPLNKVRQLARLYGLKAQDLYEIFVEEAKRQLELQLHREFNGVHRKRKASG